jgi:hypothetical protein
MRARGRAPLAGHGFKSRWCTKKSSTPFNVELSLHAVGAWPAQGKFLYGEHGARPVWGEAHISRRVLHRHGDYAR